MRGALVLLLTAVAVVAVGLDDGSYALVSRETLSPAVWLLVATGLLLGPRTRLDGVVLVPPVLLAAFAVWTAASLAWAASAERTVIEIERVVLLLGVLLLPLVLLARRDVRFAAAGIGAGVTAIAAVAIGRRLFPDETGREAGDVLVGGQRLSDPVGYWNGLGILVALGLVILLAEAGRPGAAWRRSIAAAPIPMLVCVIYLTSSRSAVAAAAVSVIALFALSPYRWALAASSVMCGAAAAVALVALGRYDALVNAPNTEKAIDQGPAFALALGITTVVLAGAVAAGARVRKPRWATRRAGWAAVGALGLLLVVGVGLSSPAERFAAFREPPATFSVPREDYIRAHLASSHGRGRWQLWEAAVDQFREHPFRGDGAGSYAAWWAQHGTVQMFVLDAHSLYLETLGELGLVGLLLLGGFLASAFIVAILRGRRLRPPERANVAALVAVGIAFAAAAGLDWMWELTVVSAVALAAIGCALVLATPDVEERRPGPRRRHRVAAVGAIVVAAAAVWPLLANTERARSRDAVRAGDLARALEYATAARALEPWAASAHLQVALVQERAGQLLAARTSMRDAVEADPDDWRLWLVSARLAVQTGAAADARRYLARAAELNPRSPLLANVEAARIGRPP